MAKSFLSLAAIGAVTLLSACGGGGGGGGGNASLESYAADLAAIDAYLLLKLSGCLDMYGADTGVGSGGMGTEASISISNAQGGVQAVTLELTTVVG